MHITSPRNIALMTLLLAASLVIGQTPTTDAPAPSPNADSTPKPASDATPKPAADTTPNPLADATKKPADPDSKDYAKASGILSAIGAGLNSGNLTLPGGILDAIAASIGKMGASASLQRRSLGNLAYGRDI